MTDTLSPSDVARLLADPSQDIRAELVAKVSHEVERGALSLEERALAEDILRALARDAALRVRQALAEHLKESRHLPRDIAIALALDVDAVALPILQYSLV